MCPEFGLVPKSHDSALSTIASHNARPKHESGSGERLLNRRSFSRGSHSLGVSALPARDDRPGFRLFHR